MFVCVCVCVSRELFPYTRGKISKVAEVHFKYPIHGLMTISIGCMANISDISVILACWKSATSLLIFKWYYVTFFWTVRSFEINIL